MPQSRSALSVVPDPQAWSGGEAFGFEIKALCDRVVAIATATPRFVLDAVGMRPLGINDDATITCWGSDRIGVIDEVRTLRATASPITARRLAEVRLGDGLGWLRSPGAFARLASVPVQGAQILRDRP